MPLGSSYDYTVGPFVALLVVGVLMLALRWTWSPHPGITRREYGLLVPVVTLTDLPAAELARDRLRRVGIRATLGDAHAVTHVTAQGHAVVRPPGHHVLVFPTDLARARSTLSG